MVASTLLILLLLSAVMTISTVHERTLIREAKTDKARAFALGMVPSLAGQLDDQNWNTIRLSARDILQSTDDAVYAIVSDRRREHEIVGSAPADQVGRIVPDLVPMSVTLATINRTNDIQFTTSYLLRDVEYPPGVIRARRGEHLVEVSANLATDPDGASRGSLRIGISLRDVERATNRAILRAVAVGAAAVLVGLLGSYWVARRLTTPVVELKASADRIAAGDLTHRAGARGSDEIGSLARAFNSMSASLQGSFEKLTATTRSFERFVPQKFLHVIAPEGIDKIVVGKFAKRTITILFSDIRGYTTLSERQSPTEIFELLNVYLDRVGNPIAEHGGFIDKYIGDAIMALFDDAHTDGAVDAALEMRRALAEYNVERRAAGQPSIDTGIGLHRGDVVMGTVGFTAKIDSTVIGDAVNLASRIEGLTKTYECAILVSDAVVSALRDPARYSMRLVDARAKVKGKEETIALYEVTSRNEPTS